MTDKRDPITSHIWSALREVRDPELPISIVDMGLVYDVRYEDGTVDIDMTFTATACPCMEFIMDDIRTRLKQEAEVEKVAINVVWDPPWTNDRLTPEGREILKVYGVSA